MHTILGAGGVIAKELARALAQRGVAVRQVSRHPRRVNATDEVRAADLLDAQATARAVEGSEVAYLVAGLRYSARVWRAEWPRVMRSAIDACKQSGARLVFFDNVYGYGRVEGWMREDTPFAPISQKGEVRTAIASALLREMGTGALQAMIVRAADFYGPGAVQSFPHVTVFERLRAGKTPQWIGDPSKVHHFTYTPDAGRAVAALGCEREAFGRTWHLPTCPELITGERFVRLACEAAARPFALAVAPRWLLRAIGLFMPVLRENEEMMYQFDQDYRFDSGRVEQAFGLSPTPYREGIAACIAAR